MWARLFKRKRATKHQGNSTPSGINFDPVARHTMLTHVLGENPHLAAGLLAGRPGYVELAIPLRNALLPPRATVQFLPDPYEWNEALRTIDRRGLEVLATYQSVRDSGAPISTLATEWLRGSGLVVAVETGSCTTIRAFARADGAEHEVTVEPPDVVEICEGIRTKFEANPCLGWYAWIEAVDDCLRGQRWLEAGRLLEEIRSGRYISWESASEVLDQKAEALRCLRAGGPGGHQFLAMAITSASPRVRRNAILALLTLRDVTGLQAALGHPSIAVRMQAAGALRGCGIAALPVFRASLGHHHWFVRWQAVQYLGDFGDAADLAGLAHMLDDLDVDVRVATIKVLARVRERSVEDKLQTMANTELRDSNGHPMRGLIRDALMAIRN